MIDTHYIQIEQTPAVYVNAYAYVYICRYMYMYIFIYMAVSRLLLYIELTPVVSVVCCMSFVRD